jgi:hypothetical protein
MDARATRTSRADEVCTGSRRLHSIVGSSARRSVLGSFVGSQVRLIAIPVRLSALSGSLMQR